MIGVLGMLMYASVSSITRMVREEFSQRSVLRQEPDGASLRAAGHHPAVPVARRRRLPVQLFSRLGQPPDDQDDARRPVRALHAAAHRMVRTRVIRIDALAAHLQHRAGRRCGDQFRHDRDSRHDHDRLAARVPVLAELAAGDLRDAGCTDHRRPGAQRQSALPPLQHAHPELDGRCDARGQGSDRRAPGRQGVQRAGTHAGGF